MTWDIDLFYAINGLGGASSILDQFFLYLSPPSHLFIPGVLAFGYWLWSRPREAVIGGGALGLLIVLADFLGAQVKHLVARPRPCQSLSQIQELVGCGGTFSFPSNHAVNTAAAAAFFQVLYPHSGWVSWPLVGLIGVSRVYLGAHYVTDVLGGWILGVALGAGAGWFLSQWSWFRPRALSEMKPANGVDGELSHGIRPE